MITILTGCSEKEKSPIIVSNTAESNSYINYTINNALTEEAAYEVPSEAIEIIKNLKFNSDESYTTMFGNESAVCISGHLYLHVSDSILVLNTETGKPDKLCTDPLCGHINNNCPDYPIVNSMISDGKSIYIKGVTETDSEFTASGSVDKVTFIGKYKTGENKITVLDSWAKENGSVSYCISEKDGYVYYLRRISDEENALYRVSVNGGKSEKISTEKEFIQQFSLTDEKIMYCTSARELKSMDYSGNEITDIASKYCMTYNKNDISINVSSVHDGGYDAEVSESNVKIKVHSPMDTFVYKNKIWYTIEKEINYGVFKNENGDSYTLKTYNGDTLYSYDLATGEIQEYLLNFGYGINDVYYVDEGYIIAALGNEYQKSDIWLVDINNTDKHWKIYEN